MAFEGTIEALYGNPIFQKALSNLNAEDIQFFKDIQSGKIDLKNKKELKKRYKEIQIRMVSNFNKWEIIRFIKVMHIITKLSMKDGFIKSKLQNNG